MPYIVLPDGSIRADSVDEAVALSLKLRAPVAHAPAPTVAPALRTPVNGWSMPHASAPIVPFALTSPPSPGGPVETAGKNSNRATLALAFLSAVLEAGSRGLGTAGMMAVFKVDNPRGLGSKSMMMRNYFKELGFAEGEAYVSSLSNDDGTVFKPGPKIEEAFGAATARLSTSF